MRIDSTTAAGFDQAGPMVHFVWYALVAIFAIGIFGRLLIGLMEIIIWVCIRMRGGPSQPSEQRLPPPETPPYGSDEWWERVHRGDIKF